MTGKKTKALSFHLKKLEEQEQQIKPNENRRQNKDSRNQ